MRLKNNLEMEYFQWLTGKVRLTSVKFSMEFLESLFKRDFYSILPNDGNREADGLKQRECFELDTGRIGAEKRLIGPCSLLEMLIALSERMNFILLDPDGTDETASIFWKLVKNLKLNPKSWTEKNDKVIDIFLNRGYSETGSGGLFPLISPKKDQREVEIWYQMMGYIEESFRI